MSLSVIVETDSVYQELNNVASNYNIDPNFIDFDILDIFTQYKIQDNEPVLSNENLDIFYDPNFILDPNLQIFQSYKVEFYDTRERKAAVLPTISLNTNKLMTHIIANIKADSAIKFAHSLEKDIISYINKKLLKLKILIGIRNTTMITEVKKIIADIRVNGIIEQDRKFSVCVWPNPVEHVNERVIFHYKTKTGSEQNGNKIDYSDRGFIKGVVAGENIIEYIKPKEGHIGRNARGEIIPIAQPKIYEDKPIEVSDCIEKVETEESIKYISKKSGYVIEEKGVYTIKDQLDLNSASFNTTGSIDTRFDSDISINISENDILKDAVGPGIAIKTSTINVNGNVGNGAHITAKNVTIGGQTHAKSTINSTFANIAVHLGTCICDEAKIGRFEGGQVKAKKVFIDTAIGGTIIAHEVYIKNLFSNVKITASTIVQIDKLNGNNNKIIIDVASMHDYESKLSDYLSKTEKLRADIANLAKELTVKYNLIKTNEESVNQIKNRVVELRAGNKEPPLSFLNKLKDYSHLVDNYGQMRNEYKQKNDLLNKELGEIKSIQNMVFEAKIINKSNWKQLNEILFKLIEPKIDVRYSTRDNQMARMIYLKPIITDDGERYEVRISNNVG